ncbi:non-ribosomal peptide synthetase [Desulfovibrio intestinalis]|uniref:L-cysteine--[L-cysteinyl-carrier protein] ligase n=1 Tax=Desulfovibrio intestinalis TaxID=58621 RepID=A0A7W8C318_9BACT|nr:non-ribosomal peptide synthetase [Desulfovibrio intestinalis]MBB5144668.1 amino acid adenylation domain-containing protein [Desulfovibrio intestinalis]
MTAQQLLGHIEKQGVRLWEEGGAVRYTAPKGVMNKDLLRQISAVKTEILDLLRAEKKGGGAETVIHPSPQQAHDPFPLNDMQAAYLVGRDEAFEIGNIACHAYIELRKTDLNLDRLHEAWQATITRHAMLRAVMLPGNMQKVLENVPPYSIHVLDLREVSSEDQELRLQEIRSGMSHHIFAPDVWPLFELRVSLLPGGVGILHMGFDQLIADGYSLQLLFRDFHTYYEGRGDLLPELDLSFRDYVLSEQSLEQSAEYQKSKNYWETRIPLLPDAPQLPLAKNPAGITNPEFSHRRFCLPKPHWIKIKQKAAELGLSPTSVVLSVYADILAAWSAEQHFTLNMTIFNRLPLHPQIMEVIGEFTALNLLEVDNRARASFAERAKNTQARLWDDLDNRYFSGVKTIREMGKIRQAGASAQMPVVFTSTIGITPTDNGNEFGLSSFGEVLYYITQTPQVWLDNQVFEQDGMLVCNWDAIEELFPQGLLDDMFTAFESLLLRLAQSDAAWLDTERRLLPEPQVLERVTFNGTSSPLPDLLLHQLFEHSAGRFPNKAAVITSGLTVTYAELRHKALRLARELRGKGVEENTLVAVMLEKGWKQVAAVLGTAYAGAAYMPVDPALPELRRQELLLEGGVSLAICENSEAQAFAWPEGVTPLVPDAFDIFEGIAAPDMGGPGGLDQPDALSSPVPTSFNQSSGTLAYVIFTSGSTGTPKGVTIDHRGAVNTILDINERFGVTEADSILGLSSLSFDLSVYDIFGILGAGGTLVIPDADKTREPGHWLQLMERHAITCWNTVPALLQMLLGECKSIKGDLSALRLAMLSGDWIPLELPEDLRSVAPHTRMVSLGGATEASIWSVAYPVDQVKEEWKSIPYGYPLKNQKLYVFNSAMEPCPDFVPGDLYIGGTGLALGYWKDEARTSESFICHPVSGERLYHTGDMARHLPGGVLEFLGRKDHQVKIGGFRIELGEIETTLKMLDGVREAILTVDQDSTQGSRCLHAHIVPADDASKDVVAEAKDTVAQDGEIAWRSLLLNSRHAARALPEGVKDIQAFSDFWASLDELCLAYMCHTLREIGLFTKKETLTTQEIMTRGGVAPVHKKLLVRWLNVLSREGLLEKLDKNLYQSQFALPQAPLDALWKQVRSLAHSIGNRHQLLTYMERSCTHLTQLFRQEINPQQLLFPEGDWAVAEDVYQYNPMSQYYYSILSAAFASIVKDRDSGKPLRVLEVGAGVGSSTAVTLPLADPAHTSYVYTDISTFFLEKAKDKFSGYEFITYNLFDINSPPLRQGYEENSFDVIIANNVLHNAANMKQTMLWLNSLLDHNGCVLILEQTGANYPLLVTMEFLIDFSELEDERVEQDSPFLSEERWKETLIQSSFLKQTAFPVPGHPCGALGQHILMAQNTRNVRTLNEPALREYLKQRLPAYMLPGRFSMLERLPLTPTGKVDRKALGTGARAQVETPKAYVMPADPFEEKMAAIWSEVLSVEKISADANFFEVGGDSLLLTKLLARMREEFTDNAVQKELTLRNLFEQPTLAGMAATLRNMLAGNKEEDDEFHTATPLIPMKKEGDKEPFFIISDGRGRLFVYKHLRRHFACNRPLYGLQVHDINAYVSSGASIETLAANYIEAIRAVQPHGPYYLGGFCMGGIIAYEMARQLESAGQEVGHVALISSMKPPFLIDDDIFAFYMLCKELMIPLEETGLDISGEEFNSVASQLSDWDKTHLRQGDWKKQVQGSLSESFLSKYEQLAQMEEMDRIRLAYDLAIKAGNQYLTRMTLDDFAGIFTIYRTSVISVAQYRPEQYGGPVTVFAPLERDPVMSKSMDVVSLWSESGARNVTFTDVEGSHVTCLEEPHVRKLAGQLNRILS